ncbi:MAG: hypothetical protein JWM37_811 [Candidatus Saccharibacteria bacterium]|nr:hypothetical protein [Candidatus Saccharibacteria bacterium]
MNELRAGVYKHYKGALYLVFGKATQSETHEKMIVYVSLYVGTVGSMFVRPYDTFFEDVTVKGRTVPRFTYIGEEVGPAVAAWYDPKSGYHGADRVDD